MKNRFVNLGRFALYIRQGTGPAASISVNGVYARLWWRIYSRRPGVSRATIAALLKASKK